jgi:hypothetical protein
MTLIDFSHQFTTKHNQVPNQASTKSLAKDYDSQKNLNSTTSGQIFSLIQAQEFICRFFLDIIKENAPESVLNQFKHLFIEPTVAINSTHRKALEVIIAADQEEDFINTFKRSIYILVNNWSAARSYQYIQNLVELLPQGLDTKVPAAPMLRRLNLWRINFVNSQNYQELKVFVSKYDNSEQRHWSHRYSSYLLVSQAVDTEKPVEQREAARIRSDQLKEQFKFQLAMYTARSQSAVVKENTSTNPTVLGDEVLRLIQKILVKRGSFSYANLANIFLKQTQGTNYKSFKQSLIKYLVFSLDNQGLAEILKTQLTEQMTHIYENYDEEIWDNNILLRTCNRVIEYLTVTSQGEPSPLFMLLATQRNTLTLAILLLKIVLLCRPTYTHLECCLAKLIQYYESQTESECDWLIRFLEILRVTLTIYADNVQYNLVNMLKENPTSSVKLDPSYYRIFSQERRKPVPVVDVTE